MRCHDNRNFTVESKLTRSSEVIRAPRDGVFEPLKKPPLTGPHTGFGEQADDVCKNPEIVS